ncbi:hypothetical protein [Herbiconiux solani]|uniref:hypothetical protein n=1 Tax=Herbiconiux solani TaxID=661329 RepID=UPI0008259EBB|nr:hypothetical protein [Herbiconiux solani]
MEDRELYDIRSASRRVKRSRRSIYYWMRHGMPFQLIGGRRYIAHADLLKMLRVRIHNERLHQFTKKD